MAREKQDYREQLALLSSLFPGRCNLTVAEAAKAMGVDRRTIKALIERRTDPLPATRVGSGKVNKSYIIPIAALARYSV